MALIAKSKGSGNFELVPQDQHVARCVMITDIGTQPSDNPKYAAKHQCILGFEMPKVLQVFDEEKGEEPAMLSKFFTVSLHEKSNLRVQLENWRGRAFTEQELEGFDIESVIGAPCMLQVIHKQGQDGSVKAVINTIMKLPQGLTCDSQYNHSRIFTLQDSTFEDFQKAPEWIQGRCKVSPEYRAWVQRMNGSSQVDPGEQTFASDGNVNDTPPPEDEVPF
jgi:hypothetical protein